ncbi:MAG TPA: response regulator [Aggregatilineales bacterium]|nr:response regulator [Aggregatilineales bacterium]
MIYKVLIVDDDKVGADSIADLVRLLGHDVQVAYGPRAAISQLALVTPDIVFLDINMPGINGLEVCRYLRRDIRTVQTPIIVISASEQPDDQTAALRAGANQYLVKPAMIEDIERAIAKTNPVLNSEP